MKKSIYIMLLISLLFLAACETVSNNKPFPKPDYVEETPTPPKK